MNRYIIIALLALPLISCENKKQKLIDKIMASGYPDHEIVVSLEDFFEGNHYWSSIGPNIHQNQPSPQQFFATLKHIRKSNRVLDVLVRIQEYEDLEWPFSDAIYIISNHSTEELQVFMTPLRPDEIYEEWMYGTPVNAPSIPVGYTVHSAWWD